MERPLAIDLFTGLHGWAEGLIAEGFRVKGYDIVDMSAVVGEPKPDHFELFLEDVLTLDGAQFKDASLIVASPPCPEYSYMAMPWSRAKQIARALRGEADFPQRYKGSRTVAELAALFDACFRIRDEASAAAGRRIPLVVENVKGAQPWVGPAQWNFGSYYLWGDVPALMPHTIKREAVKAPGMNWSDRDNPNNRRSFTEQGGRKNPGFRFDGSAEWFDQNLCALPSKSSARKAASAKIAKIPFALSSWIARTYLPTQERAA